MEKRIGHFCLLRTSRREELMEEIDIGHYQSNYNYYIFILFKAISILYIKFYNYLIIIKIVIFISVFLCKACFC